MGDGKKVTIMTLRIYHESRRTSVCEIVSIIMHRVQLVLAHSPWSEVVKISAREAITEAWRLPNADRLPSPVCLRCLLSPLLYHQPSQHNQLLKFTCCRRLFPFHGLHPRGRRCSFKRVLAARCSPTPWASTTVTNEGRSPRCP
jgi:hypothetical protein